jgi:hypothetical protein
MIEIKLAPEEKIEEICEKLGIAKTEGLYVYAAMERDEPLGCCGFAFSGSEGELRFTSIEGAGLAMIEDGLLRSSLSMMFEHGVEFVICEGSVRAVMLKRLGFNEAEGVYSLELKDSFLTHGCDCGKEKQQ